jgi:nucleoside-diphosphate-sugar epimerase
MQQVLVTGGNGAIGIHCILELLNKGYAVRTTLRSLNKQQEVKAMLKEGGITSFDALTFIEADLSKDNNWDAAMHGCTYVLHVASPTTHTKNEADMINPAVDGVLRVLAAAKKAGISRVVLTSSFGALGFSNKDRNSITTEANWTNPNDKGLAPYEKSKALAERAAWDFAKTSGIELAVINPVAVLGPSLGPSSSPSLGLIKALINASMKAIPNIPLNIVDVRDVADLHVRAMTTPQAAGQRFIASADGEISLPEIAALLKAKKPGISQKIPAGTMPNWVLRIAALFNPQAKQALLLTTVNRRIDNTKAKKILGWTPIADKEAAILAAVDTMIKFGMIS